jgi:hypothetical protein
VLGLERVGVEDNFFALGGDSMLSLQVVTRAQERGIPFALQQVYRHQTVAGLARALAEEGVAAPRAGAETAAKAGAEAGTEEAELARMLAEIEAISEDEVRRRLTP